jgi:hypothetical protein
VPLEDAYADVSRHPAHRAVVLGMITSTMLGGWLHILLVVAIVFLLIRVIRGQPV